MMAFVSHSTRDRAIVDKIKETLHANDVQAYIAEDSPEPGRPLADKIRENILGCDLFIVILTMNGKRSKFVQQEIGIAVGGNKHIIPLAEKGMDTIPLLKGKEYIHIDPDKPDEAIHSATALICRMKPKKAEVVIVHEADEFDWGMAIGVIALIISVFALCLVASKK